MKYTIATIGSHSALNILNGAKEEGFKTLLLCEKERRFYERFNVADKIIYLENLKDMGNKDIQEKLLEKNVIMIPHGSYISYLTLDFLENEFGVPIFGNKYLFRWESDRNLEREWLENSGIKIPKIFEDENIDREVIVKFHGAKGGKGYFFAENRKDIIEKVGKKENYQIQEYIKGVAMYFHFFYSPLEKDNVLMSIDRRYESNVDFLGRMPRGFEIEPSYVVVGNFPIVIRESLLEKVFDIGDKVVEQSKKIHEKGLIGPYCLETIVTDEPEIITFEISARIVAGTNPFIPYTPYSYIKYGKKMSMGRRIAVEIKNAIKEERLEDVIT
ncbi:5-formaminoimidazole-4-carboxamide-1-(beta)-D-ribofuranosyl 5'-monophosphate synthetase [Thermococci archaeon]|nr:MAG: 5-formaminoimidazole-4-carboxamide-1-(beta)-D-ribofuranosyl 5'-monophosphate synthetase [Thermococci archaeon]